MKKTIMAKILSGLLILSFVTVNGGVQPQIVKAEVVQGAGATYAYDVNGIAWSYEVDADGNAINLKLDFGRISIEEFRALTSITIPDVLDGKKVISIGNNSFSFNENILSIIIPEGVTSIGEHAFIGYKSLTSVKIPESVTNIGEFAFADCESLTSITIPKGVTKIGACFYDCKSLKEIIVAEDNRNYTIDNGVLYNKEKTKLVCCPGGKEGEYTVLNGTTSIGDYAFEGCSNLTSIGMSDNVTNIGIYAFRKCISLTKVRISKGVTKL
jgi:hypothetical protein